MSRAFWMIVGAVGGIAAYRKGTDTIARARELGPVGSAQAFADATSRFAGSTAHGLERLQNARDRRTGRLLIGTVEEVSDESSTSGATREPLPPARPVPADWVPVSGGRSAGVVIVDEAEGRPGPDAPGGARPPGPTVSSTPRTTRPRRD